MGSKERVRVALSGKHCSLQAFVRTRKARGRTRRPQRVNSVLYTVSLPYEAYKRTGKDIENDEV